MPTEKLKQALREVNVAGVERDFAEVLSGMFDVPAAAIARILYAVEHVKHPIAWRLGDRAETLIPDPEVRRAIREQANAGATRVYLRHLQQTGQKAKVRITKLVPEDQPDRICVGCPRSMECAAGSLSTPENCLNEATLGTPRQHVASRQPVTIKRVTRSGQVTVAAEQPLGDHELAAEDVEF